MEIKDVLGLKHHLRRCSQLKIHRKKYGYSHHVFIGSVDPFGCDIYHYQFVLKPWWKLYSPAQVTKARLDYSSYSDDEEIKNIFDFENGDTVVQVNRNDYPQNKEAEEKCIRRAESRVGGRNYSLAFDNCESYVNWVFSGDNTSWEYENAPLLKQMFANVIDVMASSGVFKLYYLILRLLNSSRSSRQQTFQKQNNIGHTFNKEEREISKQRASNLKLIVNKENNSQPELPISERQEQVYNSSICHIEKKETEASIPDDVSCNTSSFTKSNFEEILTSCEIIVSESIGSMARAGTRFSNCDIFRNFKQNTEQCPLSALYSVETMPADATEALFEIYNNFGEIVVPEGMELIVKFYRNNNSPFMTDVQRQKRVFRDTLSAIAGVYGCVHGSNVATMMVPDSFNIVPNIGCTLGGLLGNAAGGVGSAALLH